MFACTSRSRRQASELEVEIKQNLTLVTTNPTPAHFRTLILVLLATLAAVDTETVLVEPDTVAEFKKQRQLSRGGKAARFRSCNTFPGVSYRLGTRHCNSNTEGSFTISFYYYSPSSSGCLRRNITSVVHTESCDVRMQRRSNRSCTCPRQDPYQQHAQAAAKHGRIPKEAHFYGGE